jgi:hypothetical protein
MGWLKVGKANKRVRERGREVERVRARGRF